MSPTALLLTAAATARRRVQPEGEVEYKLYAPAAGVIVEYAPDGRITLAGSR
jgi:hypothetical protein